MPRLARSTPTPAQRGFSLVELMVAIVLGLFLVGGLASLLVSNVRTRSEFDKSSRQIENGRFAVELISEDVQHAGFIGMSRSTLASVLPTACPGSIAQLGYAPIAAPATASAPTSVYGLNSAPGCVANMKANTGVLVVTRLSTAAPIAAAAAAASEVFFQASTCDTQNTPFNIAVGGGAFTRLQKDCATPATVRRVLQHVYFVATCNVCSGAAADTTPTLKMMDYISGGNSTETPLVEGIEDLQLEYGIDIDGNGSPDCYTSNPSSPPAGELNVALCPAASLPDPVTNWSNVVAVRIHVLARNIDPSGGWKDTRTYDLGWRITGATTSASSPVGPFNDAYKRHAYSAVARIYNLSGQRE